MLRNVEVAGRPVGGLGPHQLDAVLDELAEEYPSATVRVETPDGALQATGEELGIAFDREATRRSVLAIGREGPAPDRFTDWLGALLRPRAADLAVTLDRDRVESVVVERDPTGRVPPTEPGITTESGELVAVPGADGRGLDAEEVRRRVEDAASSGAVPIVVHAEAGPVPPRFSDADAERLAARGRELTAEPLPVQAGDTVAQVPPETMRAWLRAEPVADGLRLATDPARAAADVEQLLGDVGTPPVDASFRVEGDRVVIVPGASGTRCCGPATGELVTDALGSRPDGPVTVPLDEAPPARTTADAEALGIVAPVGSFTTSYQPGQSRVVNIHRIADLTRGVVIEPGGSFSVNGFVGRRTAEKGFVSGGVIQNGVFEEGVGGGISQYATTLFNAAFFGGLDFGAYQSHSIYISRYPYGREATLSYPEPDLVIENPTPYGVLIWPTYTPSSITVTLWSTPWARGEQTDQRESQVGNCTRVTTERTRTFVEDGRTEVDHVFATYRPEEGVRC